MPTRHLWAGLAGVAVVGTVLLPADAKQYSVNFLETSSCTSWHLTFPNWSYQAPCSSAVDRSTGHRTMARIGTPERGAPPRRVHTGASRPWSDGWDSSRCYQPATRTGRPFHSLSSG